MSDTLTDNLCRYCNSPAAYVCGYNGTSAMYFYCADHVEKARLEFGLAGYYHIRIADQGPDKSGDIKVQIAPGQCLTILIVDAQGNRLSSVSVTFEGGVIQYGIVPGKR